MSVTRVDYRERQRLTTPDLRAEQDYRLAAAARHHLGPHDWGVVRGLHVTGTTPADLMLWPGIAIDGYGREILVIDRVPLAVDDFEKCWSVLLHYCDTPEQHPPGRECLDDPAPRVRQRYVITVVERAAEGPLPLGGLGLAHGDGRGHRRPPWPVRLARIGTGCSDDPEAPLIDTRDTRYVRHRASLLRAPSGAAAAQLGLRDREDLYHFLVSTRSGPPTALERRIGIDRDGDVHVWRRFVLTGARAANQVAFAAKKVAIFDAAMPAGIGRRLRVDGEITRAGKVTSALVFDQRGEGPAPTPLTTTTVDRRHPNLGTLLFGVRPIQLQLDTVARLVPAIDAVAPPVRRSRAKAVVEGPPVTAFSIELAPYDGRLRLERPSAVAPAIAVPTCGDIDRYRQDQGDEAPVVQWRPGVEVVSDPNARELHALTVSAPEATVPRTALRISGGKDDPTDSSSRLAIGTRAADGTWVGAVQMDGGRGLQLLGDEADESLRVDGALYLPAIGRDDPLFPELMALAFMGGLHQSGAVLPIIGANVSTVAPTPLQRGATFTYNLNIDYRNLTNSKPSNLVLKRCIEVVSGFTPGRGDLVFRRLGGVVLPATDGAIAIPASTFRHRADSVEIRVALLLKQGTTNGVVVAQSGPVAVVD